MRRLEKITKTPSPVSITETGNGDIKEAANGYTKEEGHGEYIEAEKEIYEHDPEFYESIKSIVPIIPDFRPMKTLEAMKSMGGQIEPQNNWNLVATELEALGRDTEEGQEDRLLFDVINSGDVKQIKLYLNEESNLRIVERFFFTYPALLFLASRISPRETIVALLIAFGKLDWILPEVEITKDDIAFIRDVETAKELKRLFPELKLKTPSDRIFRRWAKEEMGNIIWLLENENNLPYDAFSYAVDAGNLRLVKILLRHPKMQEYVSDPWNIDYPLHFAILDGKTEIVRAILESTNYDPSSSDNFLLREASKAGHVDIVKLLLKYPKVDPSAVDNDAIGLAARYGHTEVVRRLMEDKRVNPADRDNQAIKYASSKGYKEIVDLLMRDPRVKKK